MTDRWRCAPAALARGDDLAGTASTFRAFVLLEDPGPWGVDAWRDARLPEGLGAQVLRRARRHGIRPLLVRRPGRPRRPVAGAPRTLLTAYVTPEGGRLEGASVSDPREVLDLDFAALRAGRPVGLGPREAPVFAVCTHGRHDTCCAVSGRPVAQALAELEPDATWEVSHIGGDRFAGNLLILPGGWYFGRLDAGSAVETVRAWRAGHVRLDSARGRSCWPMAAQAAELAVRRAGGWSGLSDVTVIGWHTVARAEAADGSWEDADGSRGAADRPREAADRPRITAVELSTPAGPRRVRVTGVVEGRARLTCRAVRDNPLTTWHVTPA